MKVEKREVIPIPPEELIVITLTKLEATYLKSILECLAGAVPERRLATSLYLELDRLEISVGYRFENMTLIPRVSRE